MQASYLNDKISFLDLLDCVYQSGYAFVSAGVTIEATEALAAELSLLNLEVGDHETYPINKGTTREVKQLHARAYRVLGHADVPVATHLCYQLANIINMLSADLINWLPTEIGYQRYRDSRDWISPHRDRQSDELLSVTVTITGTAPVCIYAPSEDYNKLKLIDEFITEPRTVMFLRAPGFGSGEQTIHEVWPPINGKREIVNLRMRSGILNPPEKTKWK